MAKKILVVDDNAELLELLRVNFEAAGFVIAKATDGLDALEKVRSLFPDLVLLDLELPELDGFAVCEILRRDPATASIPIIMLTGLSSQFGRIIGLGCGADDYVTKPVRPAQLISRVNSLLRRPRPENRPRALTQAVEPTAPNLPEGPARSNER